MVLGPKLKYKRKEKNDEFQNPRKWGLGGASRRWTVRAYSYLT